MWTPIAKPTTQSWTQINNAVGKQIYDDPMVMYDDPNTFYDGIDPNQWTDVPKPVTSGWIKVTKPV